MTSRTHDIFAFASLVTVAANYPPTTLNAATLVTSSIGSVIGSLLPDIDQSSNRLWDLLPTGNLVGRIFRKLFLAHRTISHSLLGIYLVSNLLRWLLPGILNPNFLNLEIIFWSIMIGFISHIFLDSFTEEGVPLFFPFKLKIGFPPIPSWRIKTGKGFEKFVIFPGIILYLVWFVANDQRKIFEILKLVVK